MYEILVNHLVEFAQEKSVARWTDRLEITIAVDWDVKYQAKQTNKDHIAISKHI